jgi:tripartite-type tricarboxylate transporter receptor subunit TctC
MTLIKQLAVVLVSFTLFAVSTVSAEPFSPKKPIELIIPAAKVEALMKSQD